MEVLSLRIDCFLIFFVPNFIFMKKKRKIIISPAVANKS